jgi:uncharacterized membrane protein YhaH (DUF805 family)
MILVENWKKVVLENYANFSGRARRQEFWYYVLANAIVSAILNILGQASSIFSILAVVYGLAVIVPGIAVGVRRLHDIGKPGILLLLALIPCVGFIILIVWAAQDSQRGPNEYGASPKYPNG